MVLGLDTCVLLLEELELVLVLLVVVGVQRRVSSLSTSQSPVSSQQAVYLLRIGKFVGAPPPASESSTQFVRNELQTVFRQARWHMDVAQETPSQRLPHFEKQFLDVASASNMLRMQLCWQREPRSSKAGKHAFGMGSTQRLQARRAAEDVTRQLPSPLIAALRSRRQSFREGASPRVCL